MTESRITTWQQPDDLWAYRLEDACETCGGQGGWMTEEHERHGEEWDAIEVPHGCPTCNGTGTVAYSQHGFRTRELALVRARQVALERTREPRRYEETVEL